MNNIQTASGVANPHDGGERARACVGVDAMVDLMPMQLDNQLHAPLGAALEHDLPSGVAPALRGDASETRDVLDLVRGLIDEELPAGTATMRTVAARMRVSERTLRRRLREHDTSYEAVLDTLRRERALAAVIDPGRTVLEISASLGFSEVSAFYRAFKRWTHSTVSTYRRSASSPPPPAPPSHDGA